MGSKKQLFSVCFFFSLFCFVATTYAASVEESKVQFVQDYPGLAIALILCLGLLTIGAVRKWGITESKILIMSIDAQIKASASLSEKNFKTEMELSRKDFMEALGIIKESYITIGKEVSSACEDTKRFNLALIDEKLERKEAIASLWKEHNGHGHKIDISGHCEYTCKLTTVGVLPHDGQ